MSTDLGIVSAAMDMKATQNAYSVNVATMKATMDSMEDIANMLAQQLMNLSVGPAAPSAVDISI